MVGLLFRNAVRVLLVRRAFLPPLRVIPHPVIPHPTRGCPHIIAV